MDKEGRIRFSSHAALLPINLRVLSFHSIIMQIFISLFRQLKLETLTLFHLISATEQMTWNDGLPHEGAYTLILTQTERIRFAAHAIHRDLGVMAFRL